MVEDKKLRFLAASDLHGDSELARKLAEKAEREKVELVVLCGDILDWDETQGLIKPFVERNQKVLIIPGNHDDFDEVEEISKFYGIENIHGSSTKINEIGFFGAGGAVLPFWPGSISEDGLRESLSKGFKDLDGIEKKVMVTHMHPAGSKSEFSGFPGSIEIRKAIGKFKPKFLLHGHIHEAAGEKEMIYETYVINVGEDGEILEI